MRIPDEPPASSGPRIDPHAWLHPSRVALTSGSRPVTIRGTAAMWKITTPSAAMPRSGSPATKRTGAPA
jgi:hypothetical protein